jgi:tRNA uridine 5-carboxymethylaminomethyl modification enzyme
LPSRNYRKFTGKRDAIDKEIKRLYKTYYESDTLAKILSRPENSYNDLPNRNQALSCEIIRQVEIAIKYAGYIERQEFEVEKFKTLEDKTIPDAFDFSTVPSLRLEARQKLRKIRPSTIGQAARISGVSPADISILLVCLKRWNANEHKNPETHTSSGNDNVCGLELDE